MEGLYYTGYNQMIRRDTVEAYLRNASPPFSIADSSKAIIDPYTFTGLFKFTNASLGTYYFAVKHFNCIETWSKTGGESLFRDGSIYNYDFTNFITKAYGNNLKQKGTKYCMFSGDVNKEGNIDLTDVLQTYNDANIFVSGYAVTDLNGDNITDLNDVLIAYNNSMNFVCVIRP